MVKFRELIKKKWAISEYYFVFGRGKNM